MNRDMSSAQTRIVKQVPRRLPLHPLLDRQRQLTLRCLPCSTPPLCCLCCLLSVYVFHLLTTLTGILCFTNNLELCPQSVWTHNSQMLLQHSVYAVPPAYLTAPFPGIFISQKRAWASFCSLFICVWKQNG